jgi:hypothetical protein
MDAYQILNENNQEIAVNQTEFDNLVVRFREAFLTINNFHEQLSKHRKPIEFREEIRREINQKLQVIQSRPEMQDVDTENDAVGSVPVKIKELWIADKQLRSCFQALIAYTKMRDADIRVISVHLAEYKALYQLFRQIGRSPKFINRAIQMVPQPLPARSSKSSIGFSSRYYEPYQHLCNLADANRYLETRYNEDKQSWSFAYLYGDYQNHLDAVSLLVKITAKIVAYLQDNLSTILRLHFGRLVNLYTRTCSITMILYIRTKNTKHK